MRDDGVRLLCCGLLLPVLLGGCGSQEGAEGSGGGAQAPQPPAARDEGVETPAAPCTVDEDGCEPGAEQQTAPASTHVMELPESRSSASGSEQETAAVAATREEEAAAKRPDNDAYVAVHPHSEAHAESAVRDTALPPSASEDAEDSDARARVHASESEPVSTPAPSASPRWDGRGSP